MTTDKTTWGGEMRMFRKIHITVFFGEQTGFFKSLYSFQGVTTLKKKFIEV